MSNTPIEKKPMDETRRELKPIVDQPSNPNNLPDPDEMEERKSPARRYREQNGKGESTDFPVDE